MTDILTWRGKYADLNYDASTPAMLEASARLILSSLVEEGWIYVPSEPSLSAEEEEALAMTEEAIAALPKALRGQVEKVRSRARAELSAYEKEFAEYDQAAAVAAGEAITTVVRKRTTESDAKWAAFVAKVLEESPKLTADDAHIYRPVTAWGILQHRNGYEYEDYSLSTLITPEI